MVSPDSAHAVLLQCTPKPLKSKNTRLHCCCGACGLSQLAIMHAMCRLEKHNGLKDL